MFEKLLANLPYNPGLAKQIGFYARRMRREESIRRTGLVFIALAFMVQFFAFISPPQQTSAYSSSDMINGGFSTKSDAVAACRNNTKNYGDVLYNFGISCDAMANTAVTTIVPTQNNNQLFSMGWLSYGKNNPVTGKATDQQSYNLVRVSETLYAQRHSSFYSGGNQDKEYKALKGTTDTGQTFWILYGCGNLVFVGVPQPHQPCKYDTSLVATDNKCVKPAPKPAPTPAPKPTPTPTPVATPVKPSQPVVTTPACPYDSTILVTDSRCKPCTSNASVTTSSSQCQPCLYDSTIQRTDSQCKPCSEALSSENTDACITEHKSATNATQNIADANGTTAQANDIIVYTLFAQNNGKATVAGFTMQENLSDVLVYADAIDLGGGTIDNNNEVSWPATDIKAGSTLTHKITVRVRNPIPTDMPGTDDPNHFDHIMTNVYGNTININLPTPTVNAVVASTQSLPNTGPGSSLIIAGAIVIIAGYFFARSRLLVNESIIAIQETSGGRL